MGMLEKRRNTIAQGLEDARIAEEARSHAEDDAQKITLEAQTKATSIISEATQRADKVVVDSISFTSVLFFLGMSMGLSP